MNPKGGGAGVDPRAPPFGGAAPREDGGRRALNPT
jgi:hypothetical protein